MKPALLAALLVFTTCAYTQQGNETPPVEIRMLDYVWEPLGIDLEVGMNTAPQRRLSVLSDEETRLLAQQGLRDGLNRSWKLADTTISLNVKQLALMASAPKFKVKAKDKAPGRTLLYLQLFDKYFPTVYDEDKMLSAELNVRYRLVNGNDASSIEDKNFNVSLWRISCPGSGLMLEKFPFFPGQVSLLFDSIASWVASGNEKRKSLELLPACAYYGKGISDKASGKILFSSAVSTISLETSPGFELKTYTPKHVKNDVKKNIGGNTFAGAFTLFTGVRTDKKRFNNYTAIFPFEDGKQIYECIIPYTELEVAESERITNEDGSKSLVRGDYFTAARSVDTSAWNSINVLGDTIVKFKMKFFQNTNIIDNFWNGSDTSTIKLLPKPWKPAEKVWDVNVYGTIAGKPFSMTSAKSTYEKTFNFHDGSSITFYGRNKPTSADVYDKIADEHLKLAAILASLPYGFFNYTVSGY